MWGYEPIKSQMLLPVDPAKHPEEQTRERQREGQIVKGDSHVTALP